MKTKVNIFDYFAYSNNIFDYFAYSNYCWYQFCLKKQDKYWILSVRITDNPSDSAWWLGVCFYFIGLKLLSYIAGGLDNLSIWAITTCFVVVICIIVSLYYYYRKTEKTMLRLMKKKSTIKKRIGHVFSLLFVLFSFIFFWTIK